MNPEFLKQICGNCNKSFGVHAAQGNFCPEGDRYSDTERFRIAELSSVTGIDVADHTINTASGLTQDGVTVGDEGGEAPAIASPLQYIGRFNSSTNHFVEFVGARLADAAFIKSARFWGKVSAKCEDVSLEEGYRLEEIEAESESRFC